MRRMIGSLCVGLLAVAAANAHFVFVVPDPADATKAVVVFSDTLEPDPSVKADGFDRVAAAKLVARGADGKDTPLTHTRDGNSLKVAVPAGAKVVYGTIDLGVTQRGDAKPAHGRYYPKAIVGAVPPGGEAVGAGLEVVPVVHAGSVRFQVLAGGKPAAGVEVTVVPPGKAAADGVKAATDANGLTPAHRGTGRYAVVARKTDEKAGEAAGKKYEQVRHTATLVVDVK